MKVVHVKRNKVLKRQWSGPAYSQIQGQGGRSICHCCLRLVRELVVCDLEEFRPSFSHVCLNFYHRPPLQYGHLHAESLGNSSRASL